MPRLALHQRSSAADDLTRDPCLRLIMQKKFAALERRSQLLLQNTPLTQSHVHLGFEEANDSSTISLGAIKRCIGVREKRRRVGAICREDRNAYANSNAQAMTIDLYFRPPLPSRVDPRAPLR